MPDDGSTAPTPEAVGEALAAERRARGYVLPHRGAMAAALPELHEAYRGMYCALALEPRHLTPLEREGCWVAMLAAIGEGVGTHHLRALREAGGDAATAAGLFRLAAWAAGAACHRFLDEGWARHAGFDPATSYREGAALLAPALPPSAARLALLSIGAARDDAWALERDLEAAYAEGVPEPKIAEATSLAIWPRGVNPFVRACGTWLALLRSGRVSPSPAFAAWRDAPGQGPLPLD